MAVAVALAVPALASGLNGSVTLTSDYFWRGISQTRNELAVQGGLGYSADSGPYLGAWVSNVDFPTAAGHKSATEVDYYAGTTLPISGGWNLDVGAMRYTYLGANSQTAPASTEYYIGAGNDDLGFKAWYSRTGATWYLEANVHIRLPSHRVVLLHLGNYRFQGGGSYSEWSVELRQWWSDYFYTSVMYVYTTLSATACTDMIGASGLCGPRFVVVTGGSF